MAFPLKLQNKKNPKTPSQPSFVHFTLFPETCIDKEAGGVCVCLQVLFE